MTDDRTCTALKIRKMQKSDVQPVLKMLMRLAEQHHEVSKATPADFHKYALGSNPVSHIWVAHTDKEAVGFIEQTYGVHYPVSICYAHVNFIYVRDEFRGCNVGQHLIRKAIDAALKKGCSRFYIEAYEENKEANAFYNAIGLKPRKKSSFPLIKYEADLETMKCLVRPKGHNDQTHNEAPQAGKRGSHLSKCRP